MKKLFLLFIYCLSTIIFHSLQAQEIEWQKSIGGSGIEYVPSVHQTADGGYIYGGYSYSGISGDKNESSQGSCDYWIVKQNAGGNIEWQNTIGGNNTDACFSAIPTSDGGYICSGNSNSGISGDKTEINIGMSDFWVIKLDNTGNITWQNTIGGAGTEYLFAHAIPTADGGYICGGSSGSGISGDKITNSFGGLDYWIVKLDAYGVIAWQKTIGGNDDDILCAINQTSDGGYICGGVSLSDSSGSKNENSQGGNDYWVIKLDSLGNLQWQNTIGGNSDDFLISIQQVSDGSYICGGYSISNISGDKTESSQGSDYWVVKLDVAGAIIWQNTIGGNGHDELMSVQPTVDGGYYCTGRSRSALSGDKSEHNKGLSDGWILKLDSIGNIQWQHSIGGNDWDELTSLSLTNDGGFIVSGRSISGISGDKSEPGNGNYDYWIVKYTSIYNIITGKSFVDFNNNSTQNLGEPSATFRKFTELNTGSYAFSDINGNYSLIVIDSGNYSVEPAYLPYYNCVPSVHTAAFNSVYQTDSLNDFALQPTGIFNDLGITITPMNEFGSGFNTFYRVDYSNYGTTTLNPVVIFYPDPDISFQSANPVPNSVTPDSLVWNFGPLAPFQSGNIYITVNVNTGLPIGTLINSGAAIEPLPGDANPGSNSSYWELLTTGSWDPNDIMVNRDTLFNYELSSAPWLEYVIRFQNTGNDTAIYVRIGNNIPGKLDLNTFEVIAASHPMDLTYSAHSRLMEFTFNNILLPDSNVNEPESHGFVRYRIKPLSSLVVGDSILNRADIYFDFNDPVSTNVAVTEIVLPVGTDELAVSGGIGSLKVYPNPATDEIHVVIESDNGEAVFAGIYDMYGRLIEEVYNGLMRGDAVKLPVNLSEFSRGVYFVKMINPSTTHCIKILKL